MAGGQPGLERHDPLGARPLGVGPAGEASIAARCATYLARMLGELVLAVVRLVGQAEPALHEVDDVAVGVAVVGA